MQTPIQGRAALIVSECQRGIVEADMGALPGLAAQVAARGILGRIAQLAQCFRDLSLPVLHLTVVHRNDLADVQANSLFGVLSRRGTRIVAGRAEAEIVPQLAPRPEDFVIERSSGLIGVNGTAADATLRRLGVTSVVLAGVSTNIAVTGCAMALTDLGYQVVVAEDCTAGADASVHTLIVHHQLRMIARILPAAEIAAALQATHVGPY